MDKEDHVLYCNRPEWSDVTPVEQNDGPVAVVPIAYTDEFKDTMDYLRAVLKSGEKSERVLDLTAGAIDVNSANYTAWHVRRQVLEILGKDLYLELDYVRDIGMESPKNYQVWYHRRVIVERLGDASHELEFTEIILAGDAKNYHAWSHRQWVLEAFKLWDGELTFIDGLLAKDVRNNSAWCHRYFVINSLGGFSTTEVVMREVDYTLEKVADVPNNESAWNYLRGVLRIEKDSAVRSGVACRVGALAVSNGECAPLLVFLLGVAEERITALRTSESKGEVEYEIAHNRDAATLLCEKLIAIDPIRSKFWNYRKDRL